MSFIKISEARGWSARVVATLLWRSRPSSAVTVASSFLPNLPLHRVSKQIHKHIISAEIISITILKNKSLPEEKTILWENCSSWYFFNTVTDNRPHPLVTQSETPITDEAKKSPKRPNDEQPIPKKKVSFDCQRLLRELGMF